MNKHSELIERLKEDIDYLINREGFSELPNLTVDNIRQAITALSQGAKRIEFERNLTFKYEKLSAELQSHIDELEGVIRESVAEGVLTGDVYLKRLADAVGEDDGAK